MKGLLIKDFYMIAKHYRMHLLIIIVFLIASLFSGEKFFIYYPCVLAGMFPSTLLSYDEHNKWMQYCGTLPYTRAQIVIAKYLIGAVLTGITFILIAVSHFLFQQINGTLNLPVLMIDLSVILLLGLAMPTLSLPFMFKLGVQKGRMAYFVCIGIIFGGVALLPILFKNPTISEGINTTMNNSLSFMQYGLFPATFAVILICYTVSCLITIKLFQNKEL